jgi:lipopolysaccharide transport system ATP-binding protein
MKPILEVRNLWKQYQIGGQQTSYLSLRERLLQPFQKQQTDTFWALQDINFDVYEGECIGIIGRNGAGKSTLLKILSQITPPTKGYIKARGRVASLLEVGTGFHPELTGRENVYLNGSILGLKRSEIAAKFDEIVDFSGIEKFLDTPLKHYSSGMRLRLAFSVAAHLEPEILLIDEVLAVGDAEFQKKCLGKMDEVSKSGRTVIFVSHNLGAVRQLCSRGVLLNHGKNENFQSIHELINKYTASKISIKNFNFSGPLSSNIKLQDVLINDFSAIHTQIFVEQIHQIHIQLHLNILALISPFRVTLSIFNKYCRIFTLHDTIPTLSPIGQIVSHYEIPSHLLRPGRYRIGIGGLLSDDKSDWFWHDDVCNFTITDVWDNTIEAINHGSINLQTNTYREIL